MKLRLQRVPWTIYLIFLFSIHNVVADDQTFNCVFTVDNTKYDLTHLAGEKTANRTRDTPPTSWKDEVRFDLCGDLKQLDGVDSKDQCPTGTRVCLTKTNTKNSEDRVVAAIPIAQTSSLDAQYSSLSSPKGLSLIFHGPAYPESGTGSQKQFLNLTLECSSSTETPKIESYESGELRLQWSAPCGSSEGDHSGEDGGKDGKEGEPEKESVGSGIGWFFLVILLALAAYFCLGAYYNYSTYGASGMDLIPHRDFWKEVPYMLSDVVSHLCSSVQPRRYSRGGYISV